MQAYHQIFEKEILQKSRGIIFSYSPVKDKYLFKPYSHSTDESAVSDLSTIMRNNLLFYAFGEDEVVEYYENGAFDSLEHAAKYTYQQRLPKRNPKQDGLPSEVLLDLLIQLYEPNVYKLAVRTIFRQNDNNEIKGYDLTYFTKSDNQITLWLGQAKLGDKDYCKSGIDSDLIQKYSPNYLSDQFFFICDKRMHITQEAKELLSLIEKLNIRLLNENQEQRVKDFCKLLKEKNILIKIPCLLAYNASTVYQSPKNLYSHLEKEVETIRSYFGKKKYMFSEFDPEIIFCIFPIESIDELRNGERGFYAGLR